MSRFAQFFAFLNRATSGLDRFVLTAAASAVLMMGMRMDFSKGGEVEILQANKTVATLDLAKAQKIVVAGKLGPVTIEVDSGRVRLFEYESLRLIGTRTGWISYRGEVAVCVPCGVMIRIKGGAIKSDNGWDAIAQ